MCDGGYSKLNQLIHPFKWSDVGATDNIWSELIESARKYVEWIFCILKKRFHCLINPIDLKGPYRNEQMFNACCVLHNMILEYDGCDAWETNSGIYVYEDNLQVHPGTTFLVDK
jgi:hypothetical protein